MKRKQFILNLSKFVSGIAVLPLLKSCSDNSATLDPSSSGKSLTINQLGHHTSTNLTSQNIEDENIGRYSTSTNSLHSHDFDLTATHISNLKSGVQLI